MQKLAKIGRWANRTATEITGFCGVGLVSYGFWLAYPPSGFIVGGLIIVSGVIYKSWPNK